MPNVVDPENHEKRSFIMPREPSVDRRFRPRPERQVKLFNEIKEEDSDNSNSVSPQQDDEEESDSVSTSSTASLHDLENALIFLRIRPVERPSVAYKVSGQILVTAPLNESSTSNAKNQMHKQFTFSDIFNSDIEQASIYDRCIGSKIENEENFTIFTYGTSGSGKTYTLLGDSQRPGIIPRALEHIFTIYSNNLCPHPAAKMTNACVTILDDDAMHKQKQLRTNILNTFSDANADYAKLQQRIREEHSFFTNALENTSIFIWVSFVEIYNEQVYDLLSPEIQVSSARRKNLKIVSNEGRVFIKDLTSVHTRNGSEAYKLLMYGLQKVQYASTAINSNSSRSHCIFLIDVIKFIRPNNFTFKSYKFCDLAGSERLGKTGNVGFRLKEAQSINTSLMVLGRCLDAVNNQRKKNTDVIPFRESKLTMLLQSAILGKEKLTMIVNITPTEKYYEENLNVLGFASIAKNILYKPTNLHQAERTARYSFLTCTLASDTGNSQMEALIEENISLRNEITRITTHFQNELLHQECMLRNELIDGFKKTIDHRKQSYEERLALELETQRIMYEAKISALESAYKRLADELREEREKRTTPDKRRRMTIACDDKT